MNDFDKKLEMASNEDLNKLKIWLFKENVRVQMEKQELEEVRAALQEERRKFSLEQEAFKRRAALEAKQIQNNEMMIEKKRKILEDGFRQLSKDKQDLERKIKNISRQNNTSRSRSNTISRDTVFFYGVNSSLSLKKRYKDLLKIFHPDNPCGDEKVVLQITKEYEELRRRFSEI